MDERMVFSDSSIAKEVMLAGCIAGLGGMLPTIARVASASSVDPATSFFTGGHLAAMLIYFALALMLCIALQERRWKGALLLGIALPALITNVLSGISSVREAPRASAAALLPIASAQASDTAAAVVDPPGFWTDLRRGLGYTIAPAIVQPGAQPAVVDTGANDQLRQQIAVLEAERTSARAEADTLRAGAESLRNDAQAARLDADTLRTETERLSAELTQLRKRLDETAVKQTLVSHAPADARMWELSQAFNLRILAEQMNALSMPDAKKWGGLSGSMLNGAEPGARDVLDKVFRVIIVPTTQEYSEFCRAIQENMLMLWDSYPYKDGVPETLSPGNALAVSQYAQSLLELTKISLAKCSKPPSLDNERLALQRAASMYQVALSQ